MKKHAQDYALRPAHTPLFTDKSATVMRIQAGSNTKNVGFNLRYIILQTPLQQNECAVADGINSPHRQNFQPNNDDQNSMESFVSPILPILGLRPLFILMDCLSKIEEWCYYVYVVVLARLRCRVKGRKISLAFFASVHTSKK